MSINQRIRELRKDLGLNQTDFGARIGLKSGAISKIEQDGNTVVDQNRRIICDKFHASMHWLETGEGDMYVETESTVVEALKEQFHMSQEQKKLMDIFLSMSEEKRDAVAKAFFDFVDAASTSPTSSESVESAERKTSTEIKRSIVNAELTAEAKGEIS